VARRETTRPSRGRQRPKSSTSSPKSARKTPQQQRVATVKKAERLGLYKPPKGRITKAKAAAAQKRLDAAKRQGLTDRTKYKPLPLPKNPKAARELRQRAKQSGLKTTSRVIWAPITPKRRENPKLRTDRKTGITTIEYTSRRRDMTTGRTRVTKESRFVVGPDDLANKQRDFAAHVRRMQRRVEQAQAFDETAALRFHIGRGKSRHFGRETYSDAETAIREITRYIEKRSVAEQFAFLESVSLVLTYEDQEEE